MAFTSPKMGLRIWNLLTDLYDHAQLADNWAKVDYHDHSPGKGVQVPTEGLADGAVTGAKLASALDPTSAYTQWRYLRDQSGAFAQTSAGTWVLNPGNPDQIATTAGTGIFYIDPSEYAVSGRTPVWRMQTSCLTNATAPGCNFTVNLTPVASVAGGVSSSFVITLGANVATTTHNTPAASSMTVQTTAEFTIPAAGYYCFNNVIAAPGMTAPSRAVFHPTLQVRYI